MRYCVRKLLGSASFGKVVEAHDLQDKEQVAIMVMKTNDHHTKQSLKEIELLKFINKEKGSLFIVKLHSHFCIGDRICSVFELLSNTLYDYLMDEYPAGFSLNATRNYSKQICNALQHLSDLQIIHGDLKLDNVLLTHPEAPTIKLADFGSAFRSGEKVDPNIRARPYRSPEFILHSRIGVPTDMWSLGCILVEMFTADTLFAVSDSTAQINKFVEVLGMPPTSILDSSTRSTKFFEKTPGSDRYVLKKPRNGETYKAAGMRKMQDILDIDLEGSMYEKGEDDDNFLYEYPRRVREKVQLQERVSKRDDKICLKPGTVLNMRYCVRKLLGSGSFGKVVEAHDLQDKEQVAIKVMKTNNQHTKQSLKEIELLKFINKEKGSRFIGK
ncbi:hypothetical protein WA026_004246 [Henosepilachna vigintioctopunctata]|uniref:Protein kinase domain-containing protein n=1 Tax=Henosepilachna vigintioctopunctata TaxID=420089 RepID=A0AAW1V9H1_9CUCU